VAALLGLVALATPFLVRPTGLLLASVVLLVVLGDAARAPAPHAVAVARDLPRVVVLGDEATLTWVVAAGERALRVDLADDLRPSLGATRRGAHLEVAAHGRARATTTLQPWRRGTVRPTTLVVRTHGPLGLATRQGQRDLPGHVEVHPAFPSRRAVLQRLEVERLRSAGARPVRELGQGTEFDSLREYRHGDDVRRVDWGATARLGHPVVRTYRTERDRPVLVLVEHGRASATLVADVPRLDHLLDAAMGVVTAATRRGDRAGVLAYATDVSAAVAPARRGDQPARVAGVLHALEPELVEADHRGAFAHVAARQRRRALLVLGTDLGAAAAVDALAVALPVLTTRHEVVVASVADPALLRTLAADVPREADRGVSPARAVHRSGAAADVLARRAAVAARLEGLGARVVDEPPERLASALVDVYLDLTARGRV